MIPKIIHYCWFGGNPLPELAVKCIESWKKYCPDYEIKEWNESNFDISYCDYVKEAYNAKKWAFVSDYARFKILYENGGIYFDTDVELLKPIDDLLELGSFMGREDDAKKTISVNPGLGFAVNPGLGLCKEILDFYESIHFINDNSSINYATVVTYITEILKKHGLRQTNEIQQIEGIYIYPKDYFCPKNFDTGLTMLTENTYTIHHFDGSWFSNQYKYAVSLKRKFAKFLPKKMAEYLARFIASVKYKGFGGAIKTVVKRI